MVNDIGAVMDEGGRRNAFPIVDSRLFFAHAGVAPLPRVAADALIEFAHRASSEAQESLWVWSQVREARESAAALLGCSAGEISLLGPTSLGLNIVALGIPWKGGDEVVYYRDDYPANVYPWMALREKGVRPVTLRPRRPGAITWDDVQAALTPRTRMVALASCNFLSGHRIDVDEIGLNLQRRNVLFCLDAIQTLGAFPLSVENVDFLSADAHKWLLGPAGAGIFYVREDRRELLRPPLVGSWNVMSPQFIAQDAIHFETGGRRYEPGTLNFPGICAMLASMNLLRGIGIPHVAARILELRQRLVEAVSELGFTFALEEPADDVERRATRSGIVSITHPTRDIKDLARALAARGVTISLRQNRLGRDFIRFSPHFYNTFDEIDRAVALMRI